MRRALVGVVLAAVSCARTTAQLPGIKTQRASVWLPFQHLGRGDYPRTVLDAPVLAVVAARALAAEGLPLGRSAARAGAYRPGRGRPLPQPVVNFNTLHDSVGDAPKERGLVACIRYVEVQNRARLVCADVETAWVFLIMSNCHWPAKPLVR